jgi:DNA invertase Pin-like site-specific DNA recombinase
MKAYSYVRFSTPEQRKGFSFDRQTEGSIRLCHRHGWTLDDSVRLHDLGRSGFHGHQVVLKAFIKAIEAGQVKTPSVLIVEKLDRLSREEIDDAYNLWRTILRHGVMIATVEPERLYDRQSLNKITDIMEALLHFMVAHEESAKKSDRAKDNWQRKRKMSETTGQPIKGKRPAWLTPDFDLIPDKAEVVKLIFKMAVDGHGARSIQTHLNTSGIPNIALGYSARSKATWNLRYVEAILQDKAVIGEKQVFTGDWRNRVPVGDPIKDYFPRIIPDDLYYRAQAARKSRFTQRGPTGKTVANIFQGLLFDGTGASFTLQPASTMDRKKGIRKRLGVGGQTIPACLFERMFFRWVQDIDPMLNEAPDDPLPGLEAKLKDLDDRIADIMETLSRKRSPALSKVLADLDEQREGIAADIEAAKSVVAVDHTTMVRVIQQMQEAKDPELMRRKVKALLRLVVSRITLRIENIEGNRLNKRWTVEVKFFQNRKVSQMFVETRQGEVTDYQAFSVEVTYGTHDPEVAKNGFAIRVHAD